MTRPFNLIQQFADVVEIKAWLDPPEIASFDGERRPRGRRFRSGQTATERLIDDVLEGAAGPARLGL